MRTNSLKMNSVVDNELYTKEQMEVLGLPMTSLNISKSQKQRYIGGYGFDMKNVITLREWFMVNINPAPKKTVICCRPDQDPFFAQKKPLKTFDLDFLKTRRFLERTYGFSSIHCPLLLDKKEVIKRQERKEKRVLPRMDNSQIESVTRGLDDWMKTDIREVTNISNVSHSTLCELMKKHQLVESNRILLSDVVKINMQVMRDLRSGNAELLRHCMRAHSFMKNKGFTEDQGPFMRFKFT